MPELILPNGGWRPRDYQLPLWKYLQSGGKRAIEIAHRRWGKDDVMLHHTCIAGIERPATYWHCLPEYAQARKAIWAAVNPHTGKRRIDEAFPHELRESTNEQEMFIRFKNGATWQVIGSDRYNSLVGAGVAGVVFSEWALANPSSWAYIRPMLVENDGWAAFITTPRGENHAKSMLEHAQGSDNWFSEISSVLDTKALNEDQLEESLAEYKAIYGEDMGQAQFEQEYLVSFDAAILGAFYAGEMRRANVEGRITDVPYDPSLPVYTIQDIGWSDDTTILFFQVLRGEVRIIDTYDANGYGVEHYAKHILAKPYEYGGHWLPHDAQAQTMVAAGRTVVEQYREYGLKNIRVLPNKQTEQQGILAARKLFPRLWIDAGQTTFMNAIKQFRREWDDERKCFKDKPYVDWTNHYADALRYLAWVWKEPTPEPEKKTVSFVPSTPTFDELMKRRTRKMNG